MYGVTAAVGCDNTNDDYDDDDDDNFDVSTCCIQFQT